MKGEAGGAACTSGLKSARVAMPASLTELEVRCVGVGDAGFGSEALPVGRQAGPTGQGVVGPVSELSPESEAEEDEFGDSRGRFVGDTECAVSKRDSMVSLRTSRTRE